MGWNGVLWRLDERRLPDGRSSLLRFHSAFWDELQLLPLVGLDAHLLLVLGVYPSEGRMAMSYLLGGRQRWAAQAAQVALDAERLAACQDVMAVAMVAGRVDEEALDSVAGALLRSFYRLSRDVAAAVNQESVYNQRLALKTVEERLDGLVRELTRSREFYVVRFRPIAMAWREVVAAYRLQLAVEVEVRQEIDSPYIIGVPLTDEQEIFVGRTAVSARIEQLLLDRRQPPLFLYGQRRMGKTSLLNNLGRLLPSTIVPLFVDLQGPASRAGDETGFLFNVARGMVRSAQRRGVVLPVLTRKMLVTDPFTVFDEWLDGVEEALGGQMALLMLDEFEVLDVALAQGRFDEVAILGMLRHLIQHRTSFKVLISGSHTLAEFGRWASYLINVQVVHIGYLTVAEARQLVVMPVQGFELQYEEGAVERVLGLTRGHPFLVQLLCAEVVALKNEQPPAVRRLAGVADVEAAVEPALKHGSFFFVDIEQNQVDKDGLAVLRVLATQGEGRVMGLEALAGVVAVADLAGTLAGLVQRGVVETAVGGYCFQVELVRRWFLAG